MICQDGRARRASKAQGPDTQEKRVLEALLISELGLGGPGIKMSRGWSMGGLQVDAWTQNFILSCMGNSQKVLKQS